MIVSRRQAIAYIAGGWSLASAQSSYDLLLKNGTIVDGSGTPRFRGDVAIRGDRIAAIGQNLPAAGARHVINAADLIVAPGFIDNHAHLVTLESQPFAENFLRQGITTIMASLHSQDEPWPLGDYRTRVRMAPNVGLFAGHTWIRKRVMGLANRDPSAAELAEMRALVDESMRQGALGLATGLEYVPANFSKTDEIIELARVASKFNGYYVTHMRDEGPGLIDAVRETLRIGEVARLPVLINHLKATGAAQFGWSAQALGLIDAAVAKGQRAAFDLYPYTAFSTYSDLMFPSWALADGHEAFQRRVADPATRARLAAEMLHIFPQQAGSGPASIQIREFKPVPSLQGRTLADFLQDKGRPQTIPEAVEALIEFQTQGGFIGIFHAMDEADVRRIMKHPLAMFDTDGDLVDPSSGFPHPRSYGAFPRVLAKYVREEHLLTLEEAVRKMTSMPAKWWGQGDRGLLKPGMFADVVVFDSEKIQDRSTYTDPNHYATGIVHLLINGTLVLENGARTGNKPGRFMERPARPGKN